MCSKENADRENQKAHYKDRLKLIENLIEETNNEIDDCRYQVFFYNSNNEPCTRQEKLINLNYKKAFLERLYAAMQAALKV
ncbi:MAG: hypothetical protein XXXJIFNMEKO3_01686 [Candidatus Erwinia impunctatus]|nr:hypothetical protein MC47_003095 [Citrobacter freundii]CAJ0541850.1 hypothetical protein XXXJIFNMEKO_01686 [Culicoides impunctatus]